MTQPSSWSERAARHLPTGASTGSKRPDSLYGEPPYGPTHFVRASGCRIETAEGALLVDATMALGAVTLGYADPAVTDAVTAAASSGNVSGLSHRMEVELAERLCDVIPCAERLQFLKSGAEAVAAAVRIARARTGRERVIASGYFGWHDWCSDAAGVPSATRSLVTRVAFDDIAALNDAIDEAGTDLAAVVLEPVVERLPSREWLLHARSRCDALGAALVFDEIKTGFRFSRGGYQEVVGVTPDLATFGKAMANGFPLAAVCGHSGWMDAARDTWISSTLASETTALAACGAVLARYAQEDVCQALADKAREQAGAMRDVMHGRAEVLEAGPMWFMRFDDPTEEAAFLRTAAGRGVLFKHGPYNFASLAHDVDARRAMVEAAR